MIYKMNYDSTRYEECVADSERGVFSSKNNVSNINLNVDYNLVYFYKISNFSYSWENVEFYYDSNVSNNYEDFLFNSLGWTIISERVRSLFCDLNVRGVDFFPVKLIDLAKKMPDKIYYALYINNFIQAYDLENSQYRYIEKYDVYSFSPMKIMFNKDICDNYDIFRCSLDRIPIYVNERLYNAILNNGLVGFEFLKVSD